MTITINCWQARIGFAGFEVEVLCQITCFLPLSAVRTVPPCVELSVAHREPDCPTAQKIKQGKTFGTIRLLLKF